MNNFESGKYINQNHYKSFLPNHINRQWKIDDMQVLFLLSIADRAIGRLDMYSEYIPNINLFIKMHVTKEATQSNRIEGTQTNIEEALLDAEDIPLDKLSDWEEVQNYIKAMESAVSLTQTLPFSTRLIRQTHETLLQGVRGKHKQPGEFRKSQNWIGGVTLKDAVFIPPLHFEIPDLMSDLEKFVHNDSILLPELLKTALIHYQFETIHPFLDGNGRIGRLLIVLYLVYKNILKKPILYLSDFFEKNRMLYFDNLTRARENNNLMQWFKFFLTGIIEISNKSITTFDNILKLQKETEQKIGTLGSRTHKALTLCNYLYNNPIITTAKAAEVTLLSSSSTYRLIEDFVRLGILEEATGSQRGKKYIFRNYVRLFD
ncbi:MAG: Fic/DOC family N-terminal domain-containing protein [bacterium]